MRSIMLLYILVLLISRITSEELKNNKVEESGIKYAGPIVYSNEPPPVVYFPTPPTTSSKEGQTVEPNVTLNNQVEYVPFPYQELPILIYKSKENPPIHLVSDGTETNNLNNSSTSFDKRFGDIANSGSQRASRALKSWSQFKLFNDLPLVMKATKWTNGNMNGPNLMSGQISDMNNGSLLNPVNSQLSLANAPHVVYSGHPPIHVFPQPIIIKESLPSAELGELTSASEQYHSTALKNMKAQNLDLSLAAASNKHEVSTSPASSSFYSYGAAPPGSGPSKSYGYRVKTRGNKQDTEYSSSQNYENYEDAYSTPQHSDSSSDSPSDENNGYTRPSVNYGNSLESNSDSYDKDYDRDPRVRYPESYPREKTREKYPKYSSQNWGDWDQENGWLSSLFGSTRWPYRYRKQFNTAGTENFGYIGSPTNQIDMESLALFNPQLRGWLPGFGGYRPAATAIRPVYSLSSLLGYRRPPIPAPPPPAYFGRFNPGLVHAGSSIAPVAMKAYGFGPSLMGLPSFNYPIRVPYSPFMMYGYRRPPIAFATGPTSDLAFAESNRKANTSKTEQIKLGNNKEDMDISASHVRPTYVLPSVKQNAQSLQNKPPIIIYQGLRPPVHLYQKPDQKPKQDYDSEKMSAFQEMHEIKAQLQEQSVSTTTTTTTTTESPYYQFYSTEESKVNSGDSLDSKYKSGLSYYTSGRHGSGFSPRHTSNDDWTPMKQTVSESKKSQTDYKS